MNILKQMFSGKFNICILWILWSGVNSIPLPDKYNKDYPSPSNSNLNNYSYDKVASPNLNSDSDSNCTDCLNLKILEQHRLLKIKSDILAKLNFVNPPEMNIDTINKIMSSPSYKTLIKNENYRFRRSYHSNSYDVYENVKTGNLNSTSSIYDITKSVNSDVKVSINFEYPPKMKKIILFLRDEKYDAGEQKLNFGVFYKNIKSMVITKAEMYIKAITEIEIHDYIFLDVYVLIASDDVTKKQQAKFLQRHRINVENLAHPNSWIKLNIAKLMNHWNKETNSKNFTIAITGHVHQDKSLFTFDLDSEMKPYIKLEMREEDSHRNKRNTALMCDKSSREHRCCRYDMKIDFAEFGWHWILSPKTFNANYCRGKCPFLYENKYAHSNIIQRKISKVKPCCNPVNLAPLRVTYINEDHNVVVEDVADIIVTRCGCG
ncbi:hypothetical protein A3Q56_03177 [Intoshia linei]|uniref:TGF-beta family profile domain-containing protein n=1 Tax=Intoshia linei TaxID=1819745 RepID=A0A177B448_9BILA|nr:hypothetical protein A3Q56_03177 [Intoshia linei]